MVERGERGATRKVEEPRPAARWLASPAHWQGLGWFDGEDGEGLILWGEVQGREVQPYRTAVGMHSWTHTLAEHVIFSKHSLGENIPDATPH